MTQKERLDALTTSLEILTSQVDKLQATVKDQAGHIAALAHVSASHERRLARRERRNLKPPIDPLADRTLEERLADLRRIIAPE